MNPHDPPPAPTVAAPTVAATLPAPQPWRERVRRGLPWAYLGIAAALIPCDVYLAISLPKRNLSVHYRLT